MVYSPKIAPVEGNKAKGRTYGELIRKYNSAMADGYYGEAELIVYAFMEDRLRSFLYHINAIDRRNSRYLNEAATEIFGAFKNIDNISIKLELIVAMLKLSSDVDPPTAYAEEVKKIMRLGFDIPEFKRVVKKIRGWCEYRNEYVHALFHKDMDALRSGLKEHVEEGFKYARYLDKQVGILKSI